MNFTSSLRAMIVAALVSVCSVTASAKTLYLHTVSSADAAIELGEIKSITFGDQNVTVLLTNNSTVECTVTDFKSISTTASGNTGQTAVADLTVTDNEQWQVYDLKGNMLGNANALANGNKTLSGSLAPGVYIVKSKSQTLKLIVR